MKPHGDKHFMVDRNLIERMAGYAGVGKKDTVLEVGAGYGNLTRELAARARKVIAFEKDPDLFSHLESEFRSLRNVELICADATKVILPQVNKIVSNLPYSISRTITIQFLEMDFELAVLLYQKEFAEKLLAVPEDHQYRFISVLAQSSAEIRVLEDVSPEAFEPKPNVRSCVVELRQKKRLDRRYADFVRELFNHKNKKIRNIIENAPEDFLEKRPTSLSPSEVSALYKTVRKT